jgi:phosphopantothenoylcysteine decarboxylase/phosphopantothenate--cysteine ligase
MNYIAEALKKNSDLNHSTFENENYSQKNIYKIEDAISKPSLSIQDNIDKIKWAADYELSILKNNAEQNTKYLLGKNILVTAGPTIEQIDDVRYISNFSSGKMGYAIAEAAFNAGANVILISGPTNLNCQSGIKIINVQSADEMFSAVINNFFNTDIAILAAAVSDYKPAVKHKGKIKKNNAPKKLAIELVQTKDILLELGNQKRTNQILVGFALESDDEIQNGIKKHKEKKCDLIVINSLNQAQKVFGSDNNTITLISKDGSRRDYPTLTKRECATLILRTISDMLNDINN